MYEMCLPLFLFLNCALSPKPPAVVEREAERERAAWMITPSILCSLISPLMSLFDVFLSVDFPIRVKLGLLELDELGLLYMRRQMSERLEQREIVV